MALILNFGIMNKIQVYLLLIMGLVFHTCLYSQVDGTLDNSFNLMGAGADDQIHALAVQSDGKIIIGGDFITYNNQSANRIIRLEQDGSIDPTFAIGTGPDGRITAIAIQSDGKIIVGGAFSVFNGYEQLAIIRLNQDGSIDNGFNVGGTGLSIYQNLEHMVPMIGAIFIQPDGKILVGGNFNRFNRNWNVPPIVRLNSDGSQDAFNPPVFGKLFVESIAIDSQGRILIGGEFIAGSNRNLCRLNNDGTLDNSFVFAFSSTINTSISTICLDASQKVLIGSNTLNCLNSDGSVDNTFTLSSVVDGRVKDIQIQNDNKILVCGWLTGGITRLHNDGSHDISFATGEGAMNNGFTNINKISFQGNGKLILVGRFQTYDQTIVNNISRIYAGQPLLNADETQSPVSLNVYPNPTDDRVHISLPGAHCGFIIDSKGVILNNFLFEDSIVIETGSLPRGLYSVKVETFTLPLLLSK
jgi:uncharacterized delta-60 repeat protein